MHPRSRAGGQWIDLSIEILNQALRTAAGFYKGSGVDDYVEEVLDARVWLYSTAGKIVNGYRLMGLRVAFPRDWESWLDQKRKTWPVPEAHLSDAGRRRLWRRVEAAHVLGVATFGFDPFVDSLRTNDLVNKFKRRRPSPDRSGRARQSRVAKRRESAARSGTPGKSKGPSVRSCRRAKRVA